MEEKRFRRFKWFWAWQDQKEEAWLHRMAQQGSHLVRVVIPAVYEFSHGEPADMIYRLDYPDVKKDDIAVYLQLFQDAGWEHVDEGMGWYYFRKIADPESSNEILTDPESKILRFNRLLAFSIIIFCSLIATMVPLSARSSVFLAFKLLGMALLLLWVYISAAILLVAAELCDASISGPKTANTTRALITRLSKITTMTLILLDKLS